MRAQQSPVQKKKKVSLAADDNGHEPTHPSISIIIYTFGLSILRLVSFFPPFFRFPLFFRDFGRDVRKRERKKKVKKDILKGYGEKAPTVIECASGTEKENYYFRGEIVRCIYYSGRRAE